LFLQEQIKDIIIIPVTAGGGKMRTAVVSGPKAQKLLPVA